MRSLPWIFVLACSHREGPVIPNPEVVPYDPPAARPPWVEDRFEEAMHAYPLSQVPVIEPWSLEVLVEVGSLEVRTHVELGACLPGEEVEATACAAVYQPGRNTVQLLDFVPTEQDVVVVRYLDRELDEVE